MTAFVTQICRTLFSIKGKQLVLDVSMYWTLVSGAGPLAVDDFHIERSKHKWCST